MTKIPSSRSGAYVARLEADRTKARPEAPVGGAKKSLEVGLGATRVEPAPASDVFTIAHVPEKVVAKHGAVLEAAVADLAGIGAFTRSVGGHREKQLARALEQLYKVLGGLLDRAAPETRKEIATATLGRARELLERIGPNELAVPALTAAIGLVDVAHRLESKQRLDFGPASAGSLMDEAATAVEGLASAFTGRRGTSTAVNVLAPLVEQLLLSYAKLSRDDVRSIVAETSHFVVEGTLSEGLELSDAASLAGLVLRASAERPGDAKAALAFAREEALEPRRALVAEARAGLGQIPADVPAPWRDVRVALESAIATVLDATPAPSDQLLHAAEALRAGASRPGIVPRPVRPGGPAKPPAVAPVLGGFAQLLPKLAGSPLAAPLMQMIATRMDAFGAQPAAHTAFTRVGLAKDLHDGCAALVSAEWALRARNAQLPADVAASVADLRKLPEATALAVTLAFMTAVSAGRGDAPLLDALIRYATDHRPDDPIATFTAFAARWGEISGRMAAYPALAPERSAIMERLTLGTLGTKIEVAQLNLVLLCAQLAKQYLPTSSAASLLSIEGSAPSFIAALDGRSKLGTPLNEIFAPLLQGVQAKVKNDKALQDELGPIAVAIALETAKIVGGKGLHAKRITADWTTAVTSPERLPVAARGQSAAAVRAQQQPSVAQFVAAHPELPPDLALTAGIHLSAEQLEWLSARIAGAHGRDTVRALRDFIFACVDAGKLDLVEAARTSASPPKAISAVITRLAQSYRNNEVAKIPFDALAEGLRAGEDPEEKLVAEQTKAALAALKLDEIDARTVSQAGLREISAISANVADLLSQYSPNFKSGLDPEIDMGALRPIFLSCLAAVVDGTWPKPKYEIEVGQRLLAPLSPEQQAVWRESTIVRANAAGAAVDEPGLRDAMQLAKGLLRAIPAETRLPAGVTLDRASADALREKQNALLAELHGVEKGSARHREASKALGPIAQSLAVIELHLALEAALGGERGPGANPRETLLALRPELETAQPALKKLGARGSSEAVSEILGATRDLATTPARTGRYAADEDSLTAMIDSHKTGCLSFGDKRRRWGLAGALADANIRMLRVLDGEKQRYRTFLKMFQVSMPGYEGPALWIDAPRPDGGGNAEDLALLHRHLFEKGRAMGVPVMGPQLGEPPAGWKKANANVTFTLDDGNTGVMHSDSLFQGGKGSIRTSRGQNPKWTFAKNVVVATPPA